MCCNDYKRTGFAFLKINSAPVNILGLINLFSIYHPALKSRSKKSNTIVRASTLSKFVNQNERVSSTVTYCTRHLTNQLNKVSFDRWMFEQNAFITWLMSTAKDDKPTSTESVVYNHHLKYCFSLKGKSNSCPCTWILVWIECSKGITADSAGTKHPKCARKAINPTFFYWRYIQNICLPIEMLMVYLFQINTFATCIVSCQNDDPSIFYKAFIFADTNIFFNEFMKHYPK